MEQDKESSVTGASLVSPHRLGLNVKASGGVCVTFVGWRTGPGNKVSSSLHDSGPGGPSQSKGLVVRPSHTGINIPPPHTAPQYS